jgi:WD40 repeat protein
MHDLRQSDSAVLSLSVPSNPLMPNSPVGICCIDRLCGSGVNSIIGVGCTNGVVSIIDLRDSRIVYHNVVHKEDVRAITSSSVNWIPKEQASLNHVRLVTSSYDSTGYIWNISGGKTVGTALNRVAQFSHTGKILSVNMAASKNAMVTSGADGKALLWKSNAFSR